MAKSEDILKKNDPACKEILAKAGMTDARLWELYKKQHSIRFLNDAFVGAACIDYPFGTVTGVEFRLYLSPAYDDPSRFYLDEYVVVHYRGGAWAARCTRANSNSANFRSIGDLLDGGYYEENREVEDLEKTAYRLILKPNGGLELRKPQNQNHKEGKE